MVRARPYRAASPIVESVQCCPSTVSIWNAARNTRGVTRLLTSCRQEGHCTNCFSIIVSRSLTGVPGAGHYTRPSGSIACVDRDTTCPCQYGRSISGGSAGSRARAKYRSGNQAAGSDSATESAGVIGQPIPVERHIGAVLPSLPRHNIAVTSGTPPANAGRSRHSTSVFYRTAIMTRLP